MLGKVLPPFLFAATAVLIANRLHSLGFVDFRLEYIEQTLTENLPAGLKPYFSAIYGEVLPWLGYSSCGWDRAKSFTIISSRVVTPGGTSSAAVEVQDGIISSVQQIPPSVVGNADKQKQLFGSVLVLDFGDAVVAPGLIDVHTHLNEPGREDWEGFRSGTSAAAAGGVTLVVDMPLNSFPATTSSVELQKKKRSAAGKTYTNVAFWGGLVPDNARDAEALRSMVAGGVVGFKAFLSPSGINDFPNSSVADIAAALPTLRELDVPLMVHAELVDHTPPPGGDAASYATYLGSRQPAWEENAIAALIGALSSEELGRPPAPAAGSAGGGFGLHIAHLSSARCLPMIQEAKARGLPVTVETCPHYLNFAAEDVARGDTRFKCAPPIRTASNREELWGAVAGGDVDIVSTDHSPAPPHMKRMEDGDFMAAWGGISGLQYALPATWHGMRQRGMKPSDLARLWSTNPAKLLGISGVTGELSPGRRADITVWHPDRLADTSRAALRHKHKLTPYEDMELYGRVAATFVNGRLVFDEKRGLYPTACGDLSLRGNSSS